MQPLQARGTLVVSCLGIFGLGMTLAAIGPALPDLAANSASSVAAVGALFTALFFGSLLAQLVAGPLNDRIGQRPLLLIGLALLGLGTFGFTLSRMLPLTLSCGVIAGIGFGTVDVVLNVLIAELFHENSSAMLNLLNIFFGIGAFSGPAIAGLSFELWKTALPAIWVGTTLTAALLPFVPFIAAPPLQQQEHIPLLNTRLLLRTPLLWVLSAVILLYVGTESGISGWTTLYMQHTTALVESEAALVTAGFWLALAGGRVIGTMASNRLGASRLLILSLGASLASTLLLALSTGNALLTIAAVLLTGFSFGPIFPTVLAITTSSFRQAPGTAVSIVIAMGNIGGMILPWAQGLLLARSGAQASVLLVVTGTLAMLPLYIGYAWFGSGPGQAEAGS